MNVLIIDDSAQVRTLIERQLRGGGVDTVAEASDVSEALACLEEQNFDLVVCGGNYPTFDSFAALRAIRRVDVAVPVLLIIDEHQRARMAEAIRAGCSDYLVAPFALEALREKLEKWVGVPA